MQRNDYRVPISSDNTTTWHLHIRLWEHCGAQVKNTTRTRPTESINQGLQGLTETELTKTESDVGPMHTCYLWLCVLMFLWDS